MGVFERALATEAAAGAAFISAAAGVAIAVGPGEIGPGWVGTGCGVGTSGEGVGAGGAGFFGAPPQPATSPVRQTVNAARASLDFDMRAL